ncbi:hypothetical protein A9Q99_01245 [Gammaproteobacteria bacterium 45_16_T64]|nr:hypothetical protein A9Q99_01245 [Gammaproteobacteria bacterium 45_16_T64]
MLSRLTYAAPIALMITFGLFILMQSLISTGRYVLVDDEQYTPVNFIREKRNQELVVEQVKPVPPPKPQIAPPQPQVSSGETPQVSLETFALPSVPVQPTFSIDSGFGIGTGEGDYLPIVRVAPEYPRRALINDIEGWIIVEFTVTPKGTVRDPHIIAEEPKGIFGDVAKNAVLKFRYKPRIVNGQPISVTGVRNKITFRLAK